MDNLSAWNRYFPQLAESADPVAQTIMSNARMLMFPGDSQVVQPGTLLENYILVVHGSIRIQILTQSGREVVLYHIRPGEGCILGTACLIGNQPFPAEGIMEEKTQVLALTATEFEAALNESAQFRRLVFTTISQRLGDVVSKIELLCSPDIDRRLADTLIEMDTDATGKVTITHQELAIQLGTAREVISRHLKRFEMNGWLQLGRGTIQISMPDQLARFKEN